MDWICKQLAHSGSPFVPPSPCQTSSSSSSLHHKLKTNGRRNSSRNDTADDRNDEEDAADDRPLLHGEKSARQQQGHHLLMTASNDLQQQRQHQQQRWRQNRKSRSRTRWKRKSDDGGEGGGIKAAAAEINGRDRMEAGSRLVAFALCMLLLITIFLLLMDWTLLDPTFAHVPVDRSNIRWLELERICSGSKLPVQRNVVGRNTTNNNNNGTQSKGRSERQQNCCIVVDIIHLKRNSAKRALFFGSPMDNPTNFSAPDFESEVQLMRPKGMSVHDSDTRLWAIDSGHLMNEYVAAMALLPFVTGSLSEEQPLTEVAAVGDGKSGRQHNVLVIGLGGATLDMFWHRRFPWLNISVYELDPAVAELATRWFGAVNDGTRRTIVADGLLAIREAAEQGSLYDTVVLDACDLGGQQPPAMMPCPSGQFLGPYVLPLIRSVLAPMGTFVLNALPLQEEEPNVQRLQHKLLSVFPTCVRTRMARQMNNIFACLPYAIQPKTVEPTIGLWNERMMRLVHKMGFERLLAGANLTIDGNETTAAMNSSSSI